MSKYTFYSSPGHGWLQVPAQEVEALGLVGKITWYSYQSRDGSILYLEEDQDAGEFYNAKVAKGEKPEFESVDIPDVPYSWRPYQKGVL